MYAFEFAFVVPGRKRGMLDWTPKLLATVTLLTAVAGDHVSPASSENVVRMVMFAAAKSVQPTRIRPVTGLTSMNSLSAALPVTNAGETSRGPVHDVPAVGPLFEMW